MNEVRKIFKRWIYVVIVTLIFVIVGHHAMTYVITALTWLKSICDFGMQMLLDSAGGFLVYAVAVAAILIAIERRKNQEKEVVVEDEENVEENVSEAFDSIKGKILNFFKSKKKESSKAVDKKAEESVKENAEVDENDDDDDDFLDLEPEGSDEAESKE